MSVAERNIPGGVSLAEGRRRLFVTRCLHPRKLWFQTSNCDLNAHAAWDIIAFQLNTKSGSKKFTKEFQETHNPGNNLDKSIQTFSILSLKLACIHHPPDLWKIRSSALKSSHKFYLFQKLLVSSLRNVFRGKKPKGLVAGQNYILLFQEYGASSPIEEEFRWVIVFGFEIISCLYLGSKIYKLIPFGNCQPELYLWSTHSSRLLVFSFQ